MLLSPIDGGMVRAPRAGEGLVFCFAKPIVADAMEKRAARTSTFLQEISTDRCPPARRTPRNTGRCHKTNCARSSQLCDFGR
jgi:hypothetical protein